MRVAVLAILCILAAVSPVVAHGEEARVTSVTEAIGIPVEPADFTGSVPTQIWMEPKYLDYLSPVYFRGKSLRKQSLAIFYLLHEIGHIKHHDFGVPLTPEDEKEANRYAADNFRWFCRNKFHFTKFQTAKLWAALPPYYHFPRLWM